MNVQEGYSPTLESPPDSDFFHDKTLSDRHSSSHDSTDEATYSADNAATSESQGAVGSGWTYKAPVLLTVLLLSIGSSYTNSSMSTLKTVLMKNTYYHGELISGAKYGVMTSASHLINAILPVFSGVIIDYYGRAYMSLVSSTWIFVGCLLVAIGAQRGDFNIITGGDILQGIGNTTINTCQLKLYAHWFRGTVGGGPGIIGFVTGLDIAFNRIFGLLATVTPIPLFESTGKWYWAFWLGTIFSGFAWVLNVVYVCYDRMLPPHMKITTGYKLTKKSMHRGGLFYHLRAHLTQLLATIALIPASFWVLTIMQLLQSGVVGTYENNSVDILTQTRSGRSSASYKQASYTYSMHYAIPIVLTPLMGLGFDKLGHRSHVISMAASLYVISMCIMGFTTVHPVAPLLFDAFAYTINAVPFIATIPLLVYNQAAIGTAHGIWKAFNSAGSTIMQSAGGALQDRAIVDGAGPEDMYNYMLYLLIALKSVDIVYGFVYHYLDTHYFGSRMLLTEKQRIEKEKEETEEDRQQGLRAPKRFWTWFGCFVLTLMIATSYALFVLYWITNSQAKPGQLTAQKKGSTSRKA